MTKVLGEKSLNSSCFWSAFTRNKPLTISVSYSDHRPKNKARSPSSSTNWVSDTLTSCKRAKHEPTCVTRGFCTGSSYSAFGAWNANDMSGYGVYVLPHGVIYEGEMSDGMFHGEGSLLYPNGVTMQGIWAEGKLSSFKYQFLDGLDFTDPWDYLKGSDRRYATELEEETLRPADNEYLTNTQPTKQLSPGCYDLGNMEYNPKTRWVVMPVGEHKLNMPLTHEPREELESAADADLFCMKKHKTKIINRELWIKQHCRKYWDEATGFRPDLYEYWFTGRLEEVLTIEEERYQMLRSKSSVTFKRR